MILSHLGHFFREPGFIPRFHTRFHTFFINLLKIVRFHTWFHSTSRFSVSYPVAYPVSYLVSYPVSVSSPVTWFHTRFHTWFHMGIHWPYSTERWETIPQYTNPFTMDNCMSSILDTYSAGVSFRFHSGFIVGVIPKSEKVVKRRFRAKQEVPQRIKVGASFRFHTGFIPVSYSVSYESRFQ